MKKNRNSFFSEANMNYQGYNPMVANMPYQNANASQSFYAGMPPGNNPDYDDISSRLAKIERQINRLDHRVSKLENASTITTDDFESTTNNMYML